MKTAHDLVIAAKSRVREIPIEQAEQALLRGLLEFKLSATPALAARDLKVVLYCKTSGRAALAAAVMQDMGYLDVASIAGGYEAWVAAGKPVVKPEQPAFD